MTAQPSLFDGPDLDRDLDDPRLTSQLAVIYRLLKSGRWWKLHELAAVSGASEAGASARIRDLRKPKFGNHQIARRRISGGLYEYRMVA
jgi:hypothetical protein